MDSGHGEIIENAEVPHLNFSTTDFRRLPRFSKFVTRLLSGRNNQSEVSSVNFTFRGKVSQEFVQRILDYAFSHNVQQLNITCLPGRLYCLAEFPHSLFSSQSLKHFTFTGRIQTWNATVPTWALPNLTTLNLTYYSDTWDGLFSNCANLKNLTLKSSTILNCFGISHPGLSSLTLEDDKVRVNVVTPQLKSLTIKNWRGIHLISAPNLSSLHYTDHYCSYKDNDDGPLQLPSDLPHLEKVDIIITSDHDNKAYTHKIVRLLQQLRYVKFLTLSLELVKFFSSSVELFSHQTSPFVNLKSLKIYPSYVSPYDQAQQKVTMSTEVKDYLLGGSPGATFTMVSHEEIRVVKNVTSARNLMRKLQDQLKENIETNTSHIELDKAPVESHVKAAREQLDDMKRKVSMVQRISTLLTDVPTSYRDKDKLQARLYGLCIHIDTIMKHLDTIVKHVNDQMEIECDNKVHEAATSSQPSS
ncbi:putative leucine-rich repeat domain superfamily [Helianthus annuus]|nr:putative leucine-rich repeat domain superfamily [Helianthus annuus]KAJ0658515.1 putative leucine-rich repeat domain superfamily [Helianthus annuus]